MPYIPEDERDRVAQAGPDTPGQLNYAITMCINSYLNSARVYNYNLLNDVMGALESAKLEFYRRIVSSYESEKREENGDVY